MFKALVALTVLVSILFGVETGLNFADVLVFVVLAVITAFPFGALLSGIQEKEWKGCIPSAAITFVLFLAFKFIWNLLYAIGGLLIAGILAFLFCLHMKRKGKHKKGRR